MEILVTLNKLSTLSAREIKMTTSENSISADSVPSGEQPAKPKRNNNQPKDKKNQKPKFKGETNNVPIYYVKVVKSTFSVLMYYAAVHKL